MGSTNDSVSIEDKIYRKILDSKKKDKSKKSRKYVTSKEKLITGVISAVILLFAFGVVYYYNVFINLQYNIEANLAQIDTQLQKRKNLIINLGQTVAEYSKHEREIFTYLAELRTGINGNSEEILKEIRNNLNDDVIVSMLSENLKTWENALSQLMAIAEQYPDLKLSENFRTFMDAILEFEGKIAELRMTYNSSVNEYSTIKEQFPGYIFAKMFRFEDYSFYQVDTDAQKFFPIK